QLETFPLIVCAQPDEIEENMTSKTPTATAPVSSMYPNCGYPAGGSRRDKRSTVSLQNFGVRSGKPPASSPTTAFRSVLAILRTRTSADDGTTIDFNRYDTRERIPSDTFISTERKYCLVRRLLDGRRNTLATARA